MCRYEWRGWVEVKSIACWWHKSVHQSSWLKWSQLAWAAHKNFTYRGKLKHVKKFTWRAERADKKNITTNKYSWIENRKSTRQRLNDGIRKTSASRRISFTGFQPKQNGYTSVWKSMVSIHAVSSSEQVRSFITYLNLLGTSSWSISSLLDWRTAHDNAEKLNQGMKFLPGEGWRFRN